MIPHSLLRGNRGFEEISDVAGEIEMCAAAVILSKALTSHIEVLRGMIQLGME